MIVRRLAVLGQFQALFAPPAARMGGDRSVLEVERDLVVVGFDGERFGNGPGRRRVRVAIELDGEITMHLDRRKRSRGRQPVVLCTRRLATWSRQWLAWACTSSRLVKERSGQKLCRMEWMAP